MSDNYCYSSLKMYCKSIRRCYGRLTLANNPENTWDIKPFFWFSSYKKPLKA